MTTVNVITTITPDGEFHIITDENDVARASGFGDIHTLQKRLPAELRIGELHKIDKHPYQDYIHAYYSGNQQALEAIPQRQAGSDFQKKVWRAISAIPYGKTLSYKQLAEQSGSPAAIRAAGTVCGLNRLVLLVPCHRVVKSGGGTGSYLYGTTVKESLLRREKGIE